MKSIIQIPRIPLFTEIEEPQSYAIYIFGRTIGFYRMQIPLVMHWHVI